MHKFWNFVYDKINFAGLPEFIREIHDKNMYYIPIVDSGVAQVYQGTYQMFNEGESAGLYVKAYKGGETFTGRVWPGDSAYPDYFDPKTITWWKKWMSKFQEILPFDGLWIDMNEASN